MMEGIRMNSLEMFYIAALPKIISSKAEPMPSRSLDDLPMLGPDTDAPNQYNLNILPALNSFKSPMGGNQLTCDPFAFREKLFDVNIKFATEDRFDYDPTEPSDWESDESTKEVDQPEKEQSNSLAGAPLHLEVKHSWPAKFTEVAKVLGISQLS
ncbi:hypothetical protein LguiB_034888 [Lonicera macranthoides]